MKSAWIKLCDMVLRNQFNAQKFAFARKIQTTWKIEKLTNKLFETKQLIEVE